MLVLYRLTSVFVALTTIAAFALMVFETSVPLLVLGLSLVLVVLLIGRLLRFQFRTFQFWHLLATPALFLTSSYAFLFFLEQSYALALLGVLTVLLLTLFVEYVFTYIHLPTMYQPFSIEHLGLLMNILTLFFLSSVGFGLRLFLQAPLWILGVIFFLLSWYVVYGTLWASKVEDHRAKPYAIAGAILTTELFVAISFLPSGFYTNAAFVALTFYIFLGLTRASALHRLNKTITRRYLMIFGILVAAIVLTSQWL
ncbi:hypothetical protein HOI18_02605 [Candidatus Uhrbacteria bacterium]|nr:hypothetical protein [Candidatus Uhrbacteria bacterium]